MNLLKITSLYLILSIWTMQLFAFNAPQTQKTGLDAIGNGTMVWQMIESINYRNVIATANQPLGGGWSTPIILSSSSLESFNPILAMNQNGDAVAIWASLDPTNSTVSLLGTKKTANSNWGPAIKISADGHNIDFQSYTASININGNILVSWLEQDNNGIPVIFSANSTLEGDWSMPVIASP